MFSLVRALFSPASAEDRSSLFGWFIDSMARSDSSEACMSAFRLWAFADRPRSLSGRGAPEVSRFSCMLFLSVRGFLDYAGPTAHSRFVANSHLAFLRSGGSQRPDYSFFEAQSPGPPIPLSTLRVTPRDASRKTQGQDGVAVSFLVGLFHSLQHAGLTRRSLINELSPNLILAQGPYRLPNLPVRQDWSSTRLSVGPIVTFRSRPAISAWQSCEVRIQR